MSTVPTRTRDCCCTDVLTALSTGRRRRALSVLDRASPATERELARQVAAAETDVPPADVEGERVRSVGMDLRHVQLPALADADLVDWDRAEGTVVGTARRVLPDEDVHAVCEMDDDVWDDLFDCLASERRRVVLDALRNDDGRMGRNDLAREVVRHEDGEPFRTEDGEPSPSDDGTTRQTEEVLTSLHHVHLPKLADAGLVDDGDSVSYEGPSVLPLADTLGLLAEDDR